MLTTPLQAEAGRSGAATRPSPPELLAPAGDWDAMRAAVANGADAVYFGLDGGFNARYRAHNFSLDELPRVVEYLHSHNVRGYVTLNTLVFSDELPEALRVVRAVAEAGADAVIVQDLGLARLVGRMCPGLHVHGSTQMTLTEPLGVEFVKRLGVRRVILARELSAADVRNISGATDVPVEVFVHGALCVAYSGQCLTSESLGGRSANRGQCAQACRLPYELVVDGQVRDLGDKAYLLSPQDLAAYDLVGDLAGAGVVSLKIEGRLKSAHYVAAATQVYRAAIDALGADKPFVPTRQQELDLAQSFSRGFTHGFLDGVNHQELVHARFPKSRGVRVGRVVGRTPRGVLVEVERGRKVDGFTASAVLNVGDGVVFDEGHPEQDEQGGRVAAVTPWGKGNNPSPSPGTPGEGRGEGLPLSFGRRALTPALSRSTGRGSKGASSSAEVFEITFDRSGVNLSAVSVGSIVWKTDDPSLRRRLEDTFARDHVARRVPLAATVDARVGETLKVVVRDDLGHEVLVSWDRALEPAQKHPLTGQSFREQFGRLGDTPFELVEVKGLEAPSQAMVPKSVLNDLRREAVRRLVGLREGAGRRQVADADALESLRSDIRTRFGTGTSVPGLGELNPLPHFHVLTRSMDQLRAALDWSRAANGAGISTVYCEFEDIRQYKDAVALARSVNVPVGLATVRIIKPGEEGLLRQVGACEPDCVLVRNLAGLSFFTTHFPRLPLVADYALNVANEITAALLAEHGVARMVPSYDLSWLQLAAMLGHFPPRMFEAVVHQHMPMFHMEHCPYSHLLSNGKDYRDCGRPCERHRVDLRDRVGQSHPLVVDVGCRNTVYNGQAQSAAEYVPRMRRIGIEHFRVELLREKANDVAPLLGQYADLLAGRTAPRAAVRSLRVLNQLGVTAGTLDRD